MTLYTSIIVLTELLMMAMTIHILSYTGFTRQQKIWFLMTFLAVMLCAGAEFSIIHFNGHGRELVALFTVLTVIQFSLAPFLPVFFAGALGEQEMAKRAVPLFALHALIEIILVHWGRIFYFDQNGKYFHGDCYVIYELFYFISLVFLIISLIALGRRFKKKDKWTIVMIFIMMVASILPLILYQVHADYIGIAVCACLCYIYYNDLVQMEVQGRLIQNQNRITKIRERIITGLASLIEDRDMETGEHVARTGEYVKKIAELARSEGVYDDVINDQYISLMHTMAAMHDIGKIVVTDNILRKPGRLTEEEYEEIKEHAPAGGRIVREILEGITDEEHVRFASDIATYHHERWDGTGYPAGLKGEEIPLNARIMAIADVYDALVSKRVYKEAMAEEEALNVIKEESGRQFDPKLVRVLIKHRDEFIHAPCE